MRDGKGMAMTQPGPLPAPEAWAAVGRCVLTSVRMLLGRQVHSPHQMVGQRWRFANSTTARIYRETATGRTPHESCVLVVGFRLRGIRGPTGHALFRFESLLNTPLFVGFPGFVSKLWLEHDEQDVYRGVYAWDGVAQAEHYARSLWRVLALVSEPGSIHYRVVPGLSRETALSDPDALTPGDSADEDWWRPVSPVA